MSKEVKAWMDSMGNLHETEHDADFNDAMCISGDLDRNSVGIFGSDATPSCIANFIAQNIDTLNAIAELINRHKG